MTYMGLHLAASEKRQARAARRFAVAERELQAANDDEVTAENTEWSPTNRVEASKAHDAAKLRRIAAAKEHAAAIEELLATVPEVTP